MLYFILEKLFPGIIGGKCKCYKIPARLLNCIFVFNVSINYSVIYLFIYFLVLHRV